MEWCCSFENRWSRSRDINENPIRTRHVFIYISGTAPPIFKFKESMDLSHQSRLNSVVLLKIDEAVPEILIKTCFVRNGFSLISRERLHQFSKEQHHSINLKIGGEKNSSDISEYY